MATVTHKVVKGDTLSALARKYGTTVDAIAKLNDIKNVNLIYVGQVLYISGKPASATTSSGGSSSGGSSGGGSSSGGSSGGGSSSSTSTVSETLDMFTAKVTSFGIQAGNNNNVFAIWSNLWAAKEYLVEWDYCTSDGNWFSGTKKTIPAQNLEYLQQVDDVYSIPSNAKSVRFRVNPVSQTYKKTVNGQEQDVSWWLGYWSGYSQVGITEQKEPYKPGTPPAPTVRIDGYTLTCSVDNLESLLEYTGHDPYVEFDVLKNDVQCICTGRAKIIYFSASYSCKIEAGYNYKVRCRIEQGGVYSDFSNYSSNTNSQPSAPTRINTCRASSETSVFLSWSGVSSATSYSIEYATERNYLGTSNNSTTLNNIESTQYTVTGLESGDEYFFRVCAVNDKGSSGWTEAASTVIGAKPTAPTTWSSTTTAVSGDDLVLYWMHNSGDNSNEHAAELELTVNGTTTKVTIRNNSTDEEQKTSEYRINTFSYKDGAVIKWRVRTAGITGEYGDWSIQRTINVYAPATLAMSVTDKNGFLMSVFESFPIYINAVAGPASQTPTGYHLSIIAKDTYETIDGIGRVKMVMSGETIYSKFYNINTELILELTPGSIDLQNGVEYEIRCTSSMNTGLTAEASKSFTVSWVDELFAPNAEVSYNPDLMITNIRPYCEYYPYEYYQVTNENGNYIVTSTKLPIIDGESVDNIFTKDGDIIYSGTHNGETVYFCIRIANDRMVVPDVELAVYRREYDGKFTLIQEGLINGGNTFVTDPHPPLDYARYRIVARSTNTGAISYSDLMGYEIGEKSVVIQWAEEWSELNVEGEEIVKPAWSGSMLKLLYNIDISEKSTPDIAVVNYIGREHPVSYYGTQVGYSATWSMDVPKYDKDTLYALRRLAVYMGDVYVREPSGSGYWANINVSFAQKHRDLVIPVTIEITRVSGGI